MFHEIFMQNIYLQYGIRVMDGDIVVDVGANIGLFSLMCAAIASVTLVAVEPIPDIFQVLERNLSELDSSSVCLIKAALGNPANIQDHTDTFVYYAQAPGESTRRVVERSLRQSILATAVADHPDGEIKNALKDNVLRMSESGAVPHVCQVVNLETLMVQCDLPCIDLLKVALLSNQTST